MASLMATKPSGGSYPQALRREFPIYQNNPGLVFLDSGASAQKPASVIDGVAEFYRRDYANVHRGVYQLSQRSTDAFEVGREKTRAFLNAADVNEIVFVRGATEAINLVAQSWGPVFVEAGDEIVVSDLEHHSNFVPWQMLCERVGARLLVAPTAADGGFDLAAFEALLNGRTKMVAVTQVSNVTGAILPVPRMPVDVQALGCDFYAFSGHKAYGPSGIGVLWGRYDLLEQMPPWQTGGGMITQVTLEKTEFQEPPHRFEAGTPDISGAMGLGLALDFIEGIGRDAIQEHEQELTGYAIDRLSRIDGLRLLPAGQRRLSVLSFNLDGVHPHDVGTVLDQHGVAVRVGNHCAQPLMDKLGIAGAVRVSLGVYNDRDDIDRLAAAVEACREMFSR